MIRGVTAVGFGFQVWVLGVGDHPSMALLQQTEHGTHKTVQARFFDLAFRFKSLKSLQLSPLRSEEPNMAHIRE